MIPLRKVNILLAAFFLLAPWVSAQELRISQPQVQPQVVKPSVVTPKDATSVYKELSENKFRQQLIQAAVTAQKNKEISRLDLLRIRVASFSPSLIKKAEDLAIVQMAASGEDGPFEIDENGEIVKETIDWSNLATFIQKLIPLILELIKVFGG